MSVETTNTNPRPIAEALAAVNQLIGASIEACRPIALRTQQVALAALAESRDFVATYVAIHASGFFASTVITTYFVARTMIDLNLTISLAFARCLCEFAPEYHLCQRVQALYAFLIGDIATSVNQIKSNFPLQATEALAGLITAGLSDRRFTQGLTYVEDKLLTAVNYSSNKINIVMRALTNNATLFPVA